MLRLAILTLLTVSAFSADFDAEFKALKKGSEYRWDKTAGMDLYLFIKDGGYAIANTGSKPYTVDSRAYIRFADGKAGTVNIGGDTIPPKSIRIFSNGQIKKENTSAGFDLQ